MTLTKTLDPNGVLIAVNGNELGQPQVIEDIVDDVAAGGSTGKLLARQIFTSGTSWTPTTGATKCRLRMVGGGGAGGGTEATNANDTAVGGGGAAGAYIEHWIDAGAQLTGGTIAIGAAGTPGAAGNNAGGTGGDTTIVVQGVTYTAKGGGGGAGSAANSGSALNNAGGTHAAGTSAADIVYLGSGETGLAAYTTVRSGGKGGDSPMGSGGPRVTNSDGATAVGRGGGGSGANAGSAGVAARAGGAGLAGQIIVEEYI